MTRRQSAANLLLFAMILPLLGAMMKDPMEGARWKVTITASDSNEKDTEDVLIFKGGQFWTEKGKEKGFEPVTYEGDTRGVTTATFQATQKGKDGTKLEWTGSIISTAMTGDLVKTKPDGTTLRYTFKGER